MTLGREQFNRHLVSSDLHDIHPSLVLPARRFPDAYMRHVSSLSVTPTAKFTVLLSIQRATFVLIMLCILVQSIANSDAE